MSIHMANNKDWNPEIVRNIKIISEESVWEYSILNHNFNPELEDDFFSMVNPKVKQ